MAAALSSEHFDNLQLLLKAPSKDAVRDICVQSHRGTHRRLEETTAETMNVTTAQAAQLLRSLHLLSHHVLFHHLGSAEQILRLFPDSFHSSLKNLITKILLENSLSPTAEGVGLESRHGDRIRLSRSVVRPDLSSPDQDGGPMSVGGHRAGFHGDGGAEPGVSGHHAGRTGTHQRPAVCRRCQVIGPSRR
uniref:COMMD9 N-terminal domain-containing protein n=1 Tax=Gasterosteus aculeatus aculeatus TaxID=481459 RepID=A0AAQ4NZZ3_GASAC